jgi:hypothetical protein
VAHSHEATTLSTPAVHLSRQCQWPACVKKEKQPHREVKAEDGDVVRQQHIQRLLSIAPAARVAVRVDDTGPVSGSEQLERHAELYMCSGDTVASFRPTPPHRLSAGPRDL